MKSVTGVTVFLLAVSWSANALATYAWIYGPDTSDDIWVGDFWCDNGPFWVNWGPHVRINDELIDLYYVGDNDYITIFAGHGDDNVHTPSSEYGLAVPDKLPACEFRPFTLRENLTLQLYGEGGNDELWGTDDPFAEYLYGGDGNDVIYGADGIDLISGGPGHDWLYGQDGADLLQGGTSLTSCPHDNEQDDVCSGEDGLDQIVCRFSYGGLSSDRCNGAYEYGCELDQC